MKCAAAAQPRELAFKNSKIHLKERGGHIFMLFGFFFFLWARRRRVSDYLSELYP
jgi:hypothetical protein